MTIERPMTFRGRTSSLSLTLNTVVRITPAVHPVGALPPIPPAGCIIPLDMPAGNVNAEVLTSGRDSIVLEIRGQRLGFSPLRPNETDGVPSYDPGSGAIDWVVRVEG